MADSTHRFLAKLEESTALRYALAPVCVAVAVLLHISVIGPFLHPTGLFLAGIVAAAWFGGAGPGFLAALLATFALPQLIAMNYPLIAGFFDLPRFLTFGMTGVAVGCGATFRKLAEAALRRIELELRQARNELEMKVAERTTELRRSEALLAEAQELSQTGSFAWSVSTEEIFWSEETYRIAGYDLATKPTLELMFQRIHPEDIVFVRETLDLGIQNGMDLDFEHRFLLPDGSVKYVHIVAHAVKDDSGNLEYVGSVMDITEQHHANAALEKALVEIKKSEDQLRIIIDTIPALAWCALPDGSAEFLNQRWHDYTGLSAGEAQGWGWTVAIHPEDSTNLVEKWRTSLASGAPNESEARMRRFDGEYRWFLFRTVPLHDETGNIVRWYGTNTDIEDRKQAEEIRAAQARQASVRADVSAALSKPAHSR